MRAIYLIARREFLSYVATWGFWLSLASVPMFMALGFGLPALIENSQPTRYYALIDESGGALENAFYSSIEAESEAVREEAREQIEAIAGNNPQIQAAMDASLARVFSDDGYIRVASPGSNIDSLRPFLIGEQTIDTEEGPQPLFAAVFLRGSAESGIEIEYWSTNLTDNNLRNLIERGLSTHMRNTRLLAEGISIDALAAADALNPTVRELNPERSDGAAEVTFADRIPIIVGIAVSFGLWIIIFSVVNMLLTAMIEEKGNKVLEMMLASSRHHEILVGKLLGVAAVSATLLVFWGGLGMGMTVLLQQFASSADIPLADILGAVLDPGLLLPAFAYFIIGYLMYGAIFLAIGSLCETLQDAQTLMSPMMLVMMAPLIIIMMAAESPDSPIVSITSWVPVWTPFIMLARLPHDPPTMAIFATSGLMIFTSIVVIWGSGVLFRMGALNQANQDTVKRWFSFGAAKD